MSNQEFHHHKEYDILSHDHTLLHKNCQYVHMCHNQILEQASNQF